MTPYDSSINHPNPIPEAQSNGDGSDRALRGASATATARGIRRTGRPPSMRRSRNSRRTSWTSPAVALPRIWSTSEFLRVTSFSDRGEGVDFAAVFRIVPCIAIFFFCLALQLKRCSSDLHIMAINSCPRRSPLVRTVLGCPGRNVKSGFADILIAPRVP